MKTETRHVPSAQADLAQVDLAQADLAHAQTLRQALLDFVLDAEAEVASALEAFTAKQLKVLANGLLRDRAQMNAAVEMFAMQESAAGKPVLDWFLAQDPSLSEGDRALVKTWRNSFIGLFTVQSIEQANAPTHAPTNAAHNLGSGHAAKTFTLSNWLTSKSYSVIPSQVELETLKRVGPNDIILTRILPLTQNQWMFSGPRVLLGKLGKPKLAVAIGNFKTHHPSDLYADAPELLETAWRSVEDEYQSFIQFFGSDEVTLPGHQLSQRLTDFQAAITQARLQSTGIDEGTSLKDLADQVGLDAAEIAAELPAGISEKMIHNALEKAASPEMVMPPVDVPAHLKQAGRVTVLAHPRWGQVFLADYESIKTLLGNQRSHFDSPDFSSLDLTPEDLLLLRQFAENPEAKAFVWERLAHQYPVQLEQCLGQILERPDFSLDKDLDIFLNLFNKPLTPELPETASVPKHLHDLFQDAVTEVYQTQPKGRGKGGAAQKKGGFSR